MQDSLNEKEWVAPDPKTSVDHNFTLSQNYDGGKSYSCLHRLVPNFVEKLGKFVFGHWLKWAGRYQD